MTDRKRFEEAVRESTLNPYARLILITFASKAKYGVDGIEVWPSQAWVSKATGIGKNTVGKYMKEIVDEGWLLPANMHGRTQGYYLGLGNVPVRGTLQKRKGGAQFTTNVPVTGTLDENNVPVEAQGMSPSVNGYVPVEGTQRPRQGDLIIKNNHIEEQEEQPTTAPSVPVATADASTTPLLSTSKEEEGCSKGHEDTKALRASFGKDEEKRFRELTSSAAWGGMRPADAVRKIMGERDDETW